jgi:hypothetical protein
MGTKWINDVATINKSKNGNLYIRVNKDFNAKEGQNLVLKKKADEISESAAAGKITEERAEELKEKLQFIKYTIHQPIED